MVAGCISGSVWSWFLLIIYIAWLVHRGEKNFHKISETFTITASSGRSITITMLCDDWLEANNGTFVGKRTDGEKVIQAVRKMIEEKKADEPAAEDTPKDKAPA